MPIGIKELSEKLNVSPATISRVVNGGHKVRPETYNRVMEGIRKYDYIPNEAARDLKNRHSTTVGVVIPDFANGFHASIVSGIESYLNDKGYSIILCNYNEDYSLQIKHSKMLLSRNIAGLIIAPSGASKPYYRRYKEKDIPVIFIDNQPSDLAECNCVMIDNGAASEKLCNHMLDMYGDNLLLLSTREGSQDQKNNHPMSMYRLEVALNTFEKRGFKAREDWIHVCEKSAFEDGYRAIADFLKKGKVPGGILSMSNSIAYGAIAALQDHGLSVPEDVGVACFDAVDPTRLVRPRITTIVQPTAQIGMLAAQLVYNKLKNKELHIPDQRIIVEPDFIVGESCGYRLRHPS